ncbi:MAG TPA: SRPBCC domain-containing protein, partial [Acidimicrobiales bacterium]|nr:SRPBCC domain-containing protein [Acidimicrobiales bacterium]
MSRRTEISMDTELPVIHITREFDAPAPHVFRAHVDPGLFVRWIGPTDVRAEVDYWDARSGGSWRYVARRGEFTAGFRGCFHELREHDLVIQTQTYEGTPDRVSLDRLVLVELGPTRTRLMVTSLHESFEHRDALVASGMEHGVLDGYATLDRLLADRLDDRAEAGDHDHPDER